MKRTIILKAKDDDTEIKIICKINKKNVERSLYQSKNDKMYQFTESLADRLIDALRQVFYSSAIRRIKP